MIFQAATNRSRSMRLVRQPPDSSHVGTPDAALRLLVVDDDEVDRLLIRRVLRESQREIQIREVDTLAGGISAFAEEEFDCAIVDLLLPDGSGLTLLQRATTGARCLPPTIILTAMDDEATAMEALHHGAQDYLVKGQIDHQGLVRSIRYAVGRKRAEREASDGAERFRAVFDATGIGIAVATLDGLVLRANGAMQGLLGRSEREIQLLGVDAILHPNDRGTNDLPFADLLSGRQRHYQTDRTFLSSDGAVRCGHFVLSMAMDAIGVPRWLIIMLEDTTARKQGEAEKEKLVAQLQKALQSRDTFLAVASHELKTPVTSYWLQIQGMIRNARKSPEQYLLKSTVVSRLESIDRQVTQVNGLVEQLLDVSQISTGRLLLEPEDLDMTALASDVVERLQPLADAAGSLVTVITDAPVFGRWDKVRLEQVITNLVTNAIKYGAGKPVEVSVAEGVDSVIVTVRDQGLGVAHEDQGRIFDRFERLPASKNLGGMGLGLWITRETLKSMSGQIALESQVGVGSTFIVHVPRHPAVLTTTESGNLF